MARPTTKADLVNAANEQFEKLWKLIDSMTEEMQNAAFAFGDDFLQKQKETHWRRDKNLRDVLVHLYEWHQLLLSWINDNQNGKQKPFLPEPYNWRTYPAMNVELWKKHQNTALADAKKMLKESHNKVMNLIESFSNDELFAANRLAWTGGSTLGAYCVSTTASHYDWAMKKIKAHIKTSNQ
jgi:hypothetical protein